MTLSQGTPALKRVCQAALAILAPPPEMTVSKWAETKRILSKESSANSGQYSCEDAPYQREMMDIFNDPEVERIIYKMGAQVGKSTCIENAIGYFIDQDPSTMMIGLPDKDVVRKWSRTKLVPLLRDTPCLSNKVTDSKSGGTNEISFKTFPGGYINLAGSNSAAGLRMFPIRVVIFDELDACADNADGEGDPVELAVVRTVTYSNAKVCLASTPTLKGSSKIDKEFEHSDKRYWFVPCPDCGHEQRLIWKEEETGEYRVVFEVDEAGHLIPESVFYTCESCDSQWNDFKRYEAIKKGRWIATETFRGVAGFHLSELYSPYSTIKKVVKEFLKAKDDPEKLQVWVNTALGETWEDRGVRLDDDKLFNRREPYGQEKPEVPDGVLVLTCGVDVQDNRLEAEVKGWGIGEEAWGITYKVFYGDPGESTVWQQLEDLLFAKFRHRSGLAFQISTACIDSGGHHTQMVYDFCKNQAPRAIFAIKGIGGEGVPIVSAPANKRSGKDERKVELFTIGVDDAKTRLYSRLRKTVPGPGYCHFPISYTEEYFKQLTAEESKTRDGKRVWEKIRARNEALDVNVYAYAALQLVDPAWEQLKERIEAAIKNEKPPAKAKQQGHSRRIRHEGIKL